MYRHWLFFIILCINVLFVSAQSTRYIVRFKNKGSTNHSVQNPSTFLSQRAIDRRNRYQLSIDSTDLPVTIRYIDSLRSVGAVTILNVSKWLNQVSIQTSDAAAVTKINQFPFVQSVVPIAARYSNRPSAVQSAEPTLWNAIDTKTNSITKNFFNYGRSFGQVHIHNGEFLHNIGLRGQGMIIGMLDAGFFQYNQLRAFDSVNRNNQILGTYDFVANESSVAEDNAHGMNCFSIIAANIPGEFIGTAPKSNFYLFRTEDAATEYPIEEHNWICAAERIDSAGGDVISSSVGYYVFDNPGYNYSYANMNGNTTMVAIGADLAAKKGMLIVNAAGNEGNKSWRYIITPADGDSVLAVGAVNVDSVVAPFSSYGPSSDGQVKPDVVSVGWGTILQNSDNNVIAGNGTSFACPNMAGLATCLWQGFPELNNLKIIHALRQSAHLVAVPNNRGGFGIPDMKKAVMFLTKEFASATANISNCSVNLNWTSKDVSGMKYEIERKASGDTGYIKIGERLGSGGTLTTHSYQYTDVLTNQKGEIQYRIRQIIDTASASMVAGYIDTLQVISTGVCSTINEQVVIFPNPNNQSQIFIQVITEAPVSDLYIRISNSLGQTISTLKRSKAAGSASYELPTELLAKGTFFVSVYDGTKKISTKKLLRF